MQKRTNMVPGPWFLSGALPAGAALIAMLLALAALLSRGVLPSDIMPPLVIAAVFAASAVSGACCAARKGSGALTAGAVGGLVMLAVLLLAALFTDGGEVVSPEFLRLALAALSGGLFGGALKLRRKSRIHKNAGKARRR